MTSPLAPVPARRPDTSMSGEVVVPGWLCPAIVSWSVIAGNALVREIVWTPDAGMLNATVSGPGFPLARVIACRSEPKPESLLLRTVKVAGASRSSSHSTVRGARTGRAIRRGIEDLRDMNWHRD